MNQHAGLPNDPTLAAFQMRVEGRMVTVEGRHLPPPELLYDRPVKYARLRSTTPLLMADCRARRAGRMHIRSCKDD